MWVIFSMPLPKKLLVLDIYVGDASAALLLIEVTIFFFSARVLLLRPSYSSKKKKQPHPSSVLIGLWLLL
jgi:hypothetical protein